MKRFKVIGASKDHPRSGIFLTAQSKKMIKAVQVRRNPKIPAITWLKT